MKSSKKTENKKSNPMKKSTLEEVMGDDAPAEVVAAESQDKKVEPKLSMHIEYLGKFRPPWKPFFKWWDMVYDENLGRMKRVDAHFVIVQDGKVVNPNKATPECQCVAFNVPAVMAAKKLRDCKRVFREYDSNKEFVPENDIVGFKEPADDSAILEQKLANAEKELAEQKRKNMALRQNLGKHLGKPVLSGVEGSPIAHEKEQLMPTKEAVA
jgi:hypothetical protein